MSGALRARARTGGQGVLLAATLLSLGGCSVLGGISGGAAAIASGTATGNPAVGVAVGIGVKASVDAALKGFSRRLSDDEQMQIAGTVGAMQVGETRSWRVQHAIPFSNSSGEVTLLRSFQTPLATCKEAIFTVDDGREKQPQGLPGFVASICAGEGGSGWRWAVAEPSVYRWGALQ